MTNPYGTRSNQPQSRPRASSDISRSTLLSSRTPDCFRRGVGGETDIVQKEMYSFDDLGGESLTLRPEGTAPVCRSYIEHGMHNLPQPVRLFYIAPMFRYDRPQAGRYRQHHQFGCEAIGDPSPNIDAEIIEIGLRYITALGLSDVTVRINSIGDPATRHSYANDLRNHYAKYANDLPKVDRDRLERAPLRLLDSKEPATQRLSADAPKSLNYLSDDAQNHWENLLSLLDGLKSAYPKFNYSIDHTLVRGLDYYKPHRLRVRTIHRGQPDLAVRRRQIRSVDRHPRRKRNPRRRVRIRHRTHHPRNPTPGIA